MADLSTCYLGLDLKNPFIVAASGLTATADGVRKAARAGAGAVVLKSLFEEQLRAELSGAAASLEGAHPEAAEFFERAGMEEGAREYLGLVKESASAGVPIIASVNCLGESRWGEFASRIEDAGADAIELNVAPIPLSLDETGRRVEERLLEAVRVARQATKLPLAVKLGPNWSSLPALATEIGKLGVQGLVLFNRFFRLDLDLPGFELKAGPVRSSGDEYHESLRWIAVLSDRVPCDIAASSGVHSAEAAIKLSAVGARAIELCSVIYKRGFGVIGELSRAMESWLDENKYAGLSTLRGKAAQWKAKDPAAYLRLQYIRALTGIS